jgi:hypothetical protein
VGKEFGRVICDPSSHPDVELRLNGEETRLACVEKFGKLELPTLADIAVMIADAWETRKHDHRHLLVLWKMDLRGAFALLNIRPRDVLLNAYELLDEDNKSFIAIYLVGYFGWTGFPFAFGVVSRVLDFLVRRRIAGDLRVYVDDLFGISLAYELNADLAWVEKIIQTLLGPKAVAEDKCFAGRRLEILGWEFDLDSDLISLSARNLQKTFRYFGAAIAGEPISWKDSQKIAAYASRAVEILPMMKPFVKPLYALEKRLEHARFISRPQSLEMTAIRMWLIALSAMFLGDPSLRCTISELANRKRGLEMNELRAYDNLPTLILQVDGSLSGAGFTVSTEDGKILGCAQIMFPHELQTSSLQNAS